MSGAVVTGLGVVAPNGLGTAEWWEATLAGRSGIGPVERFDAARYATRLAGEVRGFEPTDHLPSRLVAQTDRMTQLALVAADEALADARFDPADHDPLTLAAVTSSAYGGFEFGQRELEKLWGHSPGHVSAFMSFAWFYAVNSGQLSIRHDLRGPSGVLVAEQAGGLDALAHARRAVRKGVQAVLGGGTESSMCPYGWVSHLTSGRLDPAGYTPFGAGAAGHVPGEGGAILVVEDAAAAERRGAPVYATLAGWAATCDPAPGTGRPPALRRAIEGALADAGVAPGAVDVVFADAAGVAALDRTESAAIAAVFGPDGVPVTAPKTMTGRLGAGGGPLDVAAAALALRDGVIPPTVGPEPAPEHPIDLVRAARPARVRTALVVARGFGGFNSALVLTSPDTTAPQQGANP